MRAALAIAAMIVTLGFASRQTSALQGRENVSPLGLIRMMDGQIGWATTARCGPCPPQVLSGQLVRTTNGGTNWKDITPVDSSGKRIEVPHFYAYDAHYAWAEKEPALALTSEIFRTADGGQTWKASIKPRVGPRGISFINPREGWFLADLGATMGKGFVDIYRTADGGETWTKMASSTSADQAGGLSVDGLQTGIAFLNATTGWVTGTTVPGDFVYLYVTHDGGGTWRHQDLPVPPHPQSSQHLPSQVRSRWYAFLWPPKFFTARDGILRVDFRYSLFNESTSDEKGAGSLVAFYITHDTGTTWKYSTPVLSRQGDGLGDPQRTPSCFVDVNHGWMKDGDVLYMTNDGGQQWTEARPNKFFANITQLIFISPSVGWAVRNTSPYGGSARQAPFLLKTLDGGRSWTPLDYAISR